MSLKLTLLSLATMMALGAGEAVAANAGHPAIDRALDQIRSHGGAAHASVGDRFHARDVVVDADGTEHVRFERTYAGLPVIGGDLVVHSRDGRYKSISVSLGYDLDLSTRPTLKAADAIVLAGAEFGSDFVGMPASTLVVYARGRGAARLAWQVRVLNERADMTYMVDARNGRILERWSNLETAVVTGTARTLYSGDVALTTNAITGGYEMRDLTRGGGYTIDASNSRTSGQVYKDSDNVWGNYTVSDKATMAADAQYGASVTWDYYKNVHGRSGIANNGKAAYSRANYGFRYSNAFWSNACFCMTYGNGDGVNIGPLVALDIAGHEMSHGVNASTANLIYSGESGGLNEANSDILGTMVEFYANNSNDTPDYMIGEEIYLANVPGSANQWALRKMYNPAADGRSPNCYVNTIGNLDVHYSSGVANFFYYLLAEGTGAKTYSGVNHTPTTCNGSQFAGIGRAKAQKIWYRALTVYFTSSTNYAGARAATINAAKDLYGVTSAEAIAVATAWSAVKVN
ncbi:M4 family metallopeptidase [Lysobacter sp. CFH 32150]|uniref:M4 family metallopeptidase n=1 Tax=Lysobacter sp. CFH 32150 TaxID=2927128 RepID=UPI001FA71DC9|nr:M4 family metallopeptidase [Lysobacter sp. CFH 32150]MCI4568313.1 M4 family metallopeptidase [Lysobacter sp. CFH 32150]